MTMSNFRYAGPSLRVHPCPILPGYRGTRVITRRRFCQSSTLAVSSVALTRSFAAESNEPKNGQHLLDKQAQLDRFRFWQNQDWDWYKRNIPFFESSDPELDEVYYYRWEVILRHQRYAHPDFGYVFTEFVSEQGQSSFGRFGTISAAADLHLDELRWMKDRQPAREYLRNFLLVPGAKPRAYGFAPAWVGDSLAKVHGGNNPFDGMLQACVENYHGWERGLVSYPEDNGFDPAFGLFWNTGRDMGGEYNLASTQLNAE